MNVDWTWMLIGLAVGYFVLPMATAAMRSKTA